MHSTPWLLLASPLLFWISGCSAAKTCYFSSYIGWTYSYQSKWCDYDCCTDDCCEPPELTVHTEVGAWVYGVSVTCTIIFIMIVVCIIVAASKSKQRVSVLHTASVQPTVAVVSSNQHTYTTGMGGTAWTPGAPHHLPPKPPAYSDSVYPPPSPLDSHTHASPFDVQ